MFSYPVFKVSTFELPIARACLPLKARGHFVSISTEIQIAILIFSPEERQEGEQKKGIHAKKRVSTEGSFYIFCRPFAFLGLSGEIREIFFIAIKLLF